LEKIRNFWIDSYTSDKTAFGFELISFIFTVTASLSLALNARDPNMAFIYPFFFVGSITQCYASVRRGAAWVMLLTGYFACVNVFGYLIAINII
jgi:hypothetical protein|tara:strand:- start:357 stop:638 length:282 start_codon:yes stop_codon:yes gene_type:complete